MKNKKIITAIMVGVAIASTIFATGFTAGKDKAADEIWHNNRTVKAVTICQGDTLWSIAEKYKPNNIYMPEYIYDIKELNNMDNSNIHIGDTILVYIYGNSHQYIIQGRYENGIITDINGNMWSYQDDTLGRYVVATFDDCGTVSIKDDIILEVHNND